MELNESATNADASWKKTTAGVAVLRLAVDTTAAARPDTTTMKVAGGMAIRRDMRKLRAAAGPNGGNTIGAETTTTMTAGMAAMDAMTIMTRTEAIAAVITMTTAEARGDDRRVTKAIAAAGAQADGLEIPKGTPKPLAAAGTIPIMAPAGGMETAKDTAKPPSAAGTIRITARADGTATAKDTAKPLVAAGTIPIMARVDGTAIRKAMPKPPAEAGTTAEEAHPPAVDKFRGSPPGGGPLACIAITPRRERNRRFTYPIRIC